MGKWIAALFGLLLAVLAAPAGARPAPAAAPCVSATAACTDWIGLGSQARAMVYRTYSLQRPNRHIRRALIVIHGTLRNADHYFSTATGAAFLAGALGDTVVIAPAIRSADGECKDQLAPGEVSWRCEGTSWRAGGVATNYPGLTSFDFIDALVKRLADKRAFPNLKQIVIAGHSAGGQFVSRYEMSNRVHDTLGVPVTYVVANPSSYAWPDATRAQPSGDADPAAAALAWNSETPHRNFTYGPVDAAKAPAYDRWPYGLEGRTEGYAAAIGDEVLKRQLAARPTTYLLGQVDTFPLGGFDDSPEAMAQGPTRRARGEAFVKFIDERLSARAALVIVPECGHNDRCMFTSEQALPVLFPTVP